MSKRIAVLGCGWLGIPLAVSLIEKGYSVNGSTTSENKLPQLRAKGILPFLITISEKGISGSTNEFLMDVGVLIINIPPKLRGAQSENYVKKMHLLFMEVEKSSVAYVIFISSTSIYGAIEGEVTEASTPNPSTESGIQLLAAEAIFRNSKKLHTTVIRFGGLIGGDRHPVKMLSGKKELSNGDDYVNLIHRLDCIHIIHQIITLNWWGQVANGVYPYHPTKREYYTSEAQKMNIEAPIYKEHKTNFAKKVSSRALLSVKGFCFNTSLSS